MPNLTLPGYNFLGPGNTDLSEPVTSEADQVAKTHDEAYSKAPSSDDVREADRKAIGGFISAVPHDPIGGVIGAAGISSKYLLESLTGVVYPSVPSSFSSDSVRASGKSAPPHTQTDQSRQLSGQQLNDHIRQHLRNL